MSGEDAAFYEHLTSFLKNLDLTKANEVIYTTLEKCVTSAICGGIEFTENVATLAREHPMETAVVVVVAGCIIVYFCLPEGAFMACFNNASKSGASFLSKQYEMLINQAAEISAAAKSLNEILSKFATQCFNYLKPTLIKTCDMFAAYVNFTLTQCKLQYIKLCEWLSRNLLTIVGGVVVVAGVGVVAAYSIGMWRLENEVRIRERRVQVNADLTGRAGQASGADNDIPDVHADDTVARKKAADEFLAELMEDQILKRYFCTLALGVTTKPVRVDTKTSTKTFTHYFDQEMLLNWYQSCARKRCQFVNPNNNLPPENIHSEADILVDKEAQTIIFERLEELNKKH